jgi:hypothetical protein
MSDTTGQRILALARLLADKVAQGETFHYLLAQIVQTRQIELGHSAQSVEGITKTIQKYS